MRLTELVEQYSGSKDPEITGLTQDSRKVARGWLFAALPGSKADGRVFIEDAVARGAAAVLAPAGASLPPGAESAVLVTVDNPRRALSLAAAKFYARQPETIVAVTGTNGKTSTVYFTQQIWEAAGRKAASLGTLGVRGAGVDREGSMTTPDPVTLHAELSSLAGAGVTHLAMEASSHGLDQHRLDGVPVKAAGFTNLTRDHLDYHPTMEDYLRAKARLFEAVVETGGHAVLNADTPEYEALSEICRKRGVKVMGYGRAGAALRLVERRPLPEGQALTLEMDGKKYEFTLPLVGAFQAMNALCAVGLAMAEASLTPAKIIEVLASLKGTPGRLQSVTGHPRGAAVYVDYAHTPDALQNVLEALRPHTRGRLVCLVGCGGDRDPGKRPIMGRIAAELADMAIITDDNPRTEDAAKIRAAVMAGARGAQEIAGRRTAIRQAMEGLREGDVLVLAGKGHEQGQIIGTVTEPFDDVEEARSAMKILDKERQAS